MHRDGFNPDDVQLEDLLCDFCGIAAWAQGTPCVEGHRGSLICGDCLSKAWLQLAVREIGLPIGTCCLCLQPSDDPGFVGSRTEGHACRQCVKRAAGALHKSKDWPWQKPTMDSTDP